MFEDCLGPCCAHQDPIETLVDCRPDFISSVPHMTMPSFLFLYCMTVVYFTGGDFTTFLCVLILNFFTLDVLGILLSVCGAQWKIRVPTE